MCLHDMCVGIHVPQYIYGSQRKGFFMERVLSFQLYLGSRDQTQPTKFVATAFAFWATLLISGFLVCLRWNLIARQLHSLRVCASQVLGLQTHTLYVICF